MIIRYELQGIEDMTLVEVFELPYPHTHIVRAIRRLYLWYNDPDWYLDQFEIVVRYLESHHVANEVAAAALLYALLDLFTPWKSDSRYKQFLQSVKIWLSKRNLSMRRIKYRHVRPLKKWDVS